MSKYYKRRKGRSKKLEVRSKNESRRSLFPLSLLVKLSWLSLFLLAPFSAAQLSYKGEIELTTDLSLTSSSERLSENFGLTLRGHLEADYTLNPIDFRVVLDPMLRIPNSTIEASFVEPGVTEAFALYRIGNVDLSAGLERLPLEYTRLSVPYRIEPVGKTGQPLGLLGARASIFLDSWRIRPALIYRSQDEQLGGVVSVRKDFTSFELEAHALYLEGFAGGLGGSGLVGDIVIYGEAWLLSDPWDGRGAFGLSGFWGDALWTTELAYAPNPLDSNSNAFPQLLGQLMLPQGDNGNWDLNIGIGLANSLLTPDSSTLQGLASLLYTHSENDYQVTLGPSIAHTELATAYSFRIGVTSFF